MKALFMRKMLPGRQSRRNNWRILPCLLVFVACIFSLSLCGNRCLKAQESEVISEGEFVFDSLNGMIKEYLGEGGGEVIIPAEIKGSPVLAIGDDIFKDKHIQAVSLPEGLQHIGIDAFLRDELTHLELPSTLISIGDYAFQYNKLETLRLPEGMETIGEHAFTGNQLLSLEVPASIQRIGSDAFRGNRLRSLVFAENSSLLEIGIGAFANNHFFYVDLPQQLKTIGGEAFENNLLYETPALPATILDQGTNIFSDNLITEP